jgi:CopG family nickel-responsive transcriptional regulator
MRISMNLPDELLNKFDEVLKENRYTSRRNGLQDAIKEYIVCKKRGKLQ